MRLLIVKTSSMGDVVHATPVVNDIRRQHPGAVIDWLVEAPFAAIPQLHPGVRRVWPMAWRKWRGQLLRAATWRTMRSLRDDLRDQRYELVLDLQGLLKSALWARQSGSPVAATAMGRSYDPVYFLRVGVRGVKPDATKAKGWYEKALSGGDRTAEADLQNLTAWLTKQ